MKEVGIEIELRRTASSVLCRKQKTCTDEKTLRSVVMKRAVRMREKMLFRSFLRNSLQVYYAGNNRRVQMRKL